jgi:hypothetical protein
MKRVEVKLVDSHSTSVDIGINPIEIREVERQTSISELIAEV